jgi:hypothetical protein
LRAREQIAPMGSDIGRAQDAVTEPGKDGARIKAQGTFPGEFERCSAPVIAEICRRWPGSFDDFWESRFP